MNIYGMRVIKRSGKPFKSGLKIARVYEVVINPDSGDFAFKFYEDDSIVDIKQCKPLETEQ